MASLKKLVKFMVVVLALASVATSVEACNDGCGSGKGGSGSGSGSGGGAGGAAGGGAPVPRTCPINTVRLNVCSPLLGGSPAPGCCPLLGLLGVDLEVCLCLAVDVNVLGLVNVNIPKLDIVASVATACGYRLPPNFTCPP